MEKCIYKTFLVLETRMSYKNRTAAKILYTLSIISLSLCMFYMCNNTDNNDGNNSGGRDYDHHIDLMKTNE